MRGTADLGIIIERASGSVLVVDTTARKTLGRVEGFGDLSHASAVFSRDERFAYVFGRDGGLTKVDILEMAIAARKVQAGNSIGGAISDDGRSIAVSNYEPGGVRSSTRTTQRGREHSRQLGRWKALENRRACRCAGLFSFSVSMTQAKSGPGLFRRRVAESDALCGHRRVALRRHPDRRPVLHGRAVRRGRPNPTSPI